MSTRWYPIYQKGNPQLRVFLPNFWMKLVRPLMEQPKNVVTFACSMEMTKHDVKNYLEKIYNVKSVEVRLDIQMGKTRKDPGKGYVVKDDDIKYATVHLPKNESFEFPNLCPDTSMKEQEESYNKSLVEVKKGLDKYLEKNKERRGLPGWFTV